MRILVMATLAAPLVVLPSVFYPYVVPRAAFVRTLVLLGLVLLVHLALRYRLRFASKDLPLLGLSAFLVAALLSAVLGVAPLRSVYGDFNRMWGVLTLFHLAGFYLLLRIALDERMWRRYTDGVVVVGILVTVVGLLHAYAYLIPGARFGNYTGADGFRVSSTLGNPGYLAAYLVLVGSITMSRVATTRSPMARGILIAAVCSQVWLLLLTRSRAALLGVGIAITVASIIVLLLNRRYRWIPVTALFGAASLAVGLVLFPGAEIWSRLPGVDRVAGSLAREEIRIDLWAAAVRAALQRPLTGWGMENTNVALNAGVDPSLHRFGSAATIFWDRAHNAFLEAWVGAGIVGLGSYLLFWGGTFATIFLAWRRGKLESTVALALAGGIVAYLAHLFFWFEEWTSSLVVLSIVGFATFRLTGRPLLEFEPRQDTSAARAGVLTGFAAVLLLLAVYQLSIRPLAATQLAAQGIRASDSITKIDLLTEAVERAGVQGPQVLFQLVAALRTAPIQTDTQRAAVEDGLQVAIAAITQEITRDPLNDLLYAQRSDLFRAMMILFGSRAAYDAAAADADTAIALAPIRMANYHRAADLHLLIENPGRALEILRQAESVSDEVSVTNEMAARAELQLDRPELAFERGVRALTGPSSTHNPAFSLRLAQRLADQSRADLAARLLERYLRRWYEGESAGGDSDLAELRPPDREIAARLPIDFLRNGDPEAASEAAEFLRDHASDAGRGVARFLADVGEGRESSWLRLRAVPLSDWRP